MPAHEAARPHPGAPELLQGAHHAPQVDYSNGFHAQSTKRFGQDFVDIVANPNEMLLFFKKKAHAPRQPRDGGCRHGSLTASKCMTEAVTDDEPEPEQAAPKLDQILHDLIESESFQFSVFSDTSLNEVRYEPRFAA